MRGLVDIHQLQIGYVWMTIHCIVTVALRFVYRFETTLRKWEGHGITYFLVPSMVTESFVYCTALGPLAKQTRIYTF